MSQSGLYIFGVSYHITSSFFLFLKENKGTNKDSRILLNKNHSGPWRQHKVNSCPAHTQAATWLLCSCQRWSVSSLQHNRFITLTLFFWMGTSWNIIFFSFSGPPSFPPFGVPSLFLPFFVPPLRLISPRVIVRHANHVRRGNYPAVTVQKKYKRLCVDVVRLKFRPLAVCRRINAGLQTPASLSPPLVRPAVS